MVENVIELGIRTLVMLAVPVVAAASLVGTLVGIVQSATSIEEQALSYALKLAAVCAALYFLFPLYRDSMIQLFEAALGSS